MKSRVVIIYIDSHELNDVIFSKLQVSKQLFQSAFIILVLSNPMIESDLMFCKKSGATIILYDEQFQKTAQLEIITSFAIKNNYISISEHQLVPGEPIDFSIFYFLPINNKMIKLFNKDTSLAEKDFKKISNNHNLFVDRVGLDSLKEYSDKHSTNTIETDATKKIKEIYFFLYAKYFELLFLSFDVAAGLEKEKAKSLLKICTDYTSTVIDKIHSYDELASLVDQNAFYPENIFHRAPAVAIYSAWLVRKIAKEQTEDTIISALLTYLGVCELEHEYLKKIMTEGFFKIKRENNPYYGHPNKSFEICQKLSLQLSPSAKDAIISTHERHDGKGFPREIFGKDIPISAAIVHFFHTVDESFIKRSISNEFSLKQFLLDLVEENEKSSGRFNPDLLVKIKSAIEKSN